MAKEYEKVQITFKFHTLNTTKCANSVAYYDLFWCNKWSLSGLDWQFAITWFNYNLLFIQWAPITLFLVVGYIPLFHITCSFMKIWHMDILYIYLNYHVIEFMTVKKRMFLGLLAEMKVSLPEVD